MTWRITDKSERSWGNEPVVPSSVLYQYDEPIVFVARMGLFEAIFIKIDELDNGNSLFLSSGVEDRVIESLVGGQISLRGAISQDLCFVVELTSERRVARYWPRRREEVPEELLPDAALGLKAEFGKVPDTMEQVDAFFAARFTGPNMTEDSIAFSTFKVLVDGMYEAARRILAPIALIGSRSGTFDLRIGTPRLGSLVISVKELVLDEKNISRRVNKDKVDLDVYANEVDNNRVEFFDELNETVKLARKSPLSLSFAQQKFELLDHISEIVPHQNSRIDGVEFNAYINGVNRHIYVDSLVGQRIRIAHQLVESTAVSEYGAVIEINAKSKTFVIISRRGKEVTCKPTDVTFDHFIGTQELDIGVKIRMTGKLQRRVRRDYFIVEEMYINPN